MRVVLSPWHGLNTTYCNDGAFDITGATFNNLRTIVLELTFVFVQIDGVTDNGADGR